MYNPAVFFFYQKPKADRLRGTMFQQGATGNGTTIEGTYMSGTMYSEQTNPFRGTPGSSALRQGPASPCQGSFGGNGRLTEHYPT